MAIPDGRSVYVAGGTASKLNSTMNVVADDHPSIVVRAFYDAVIYVEAVRIA